MAKKRKKKRYIHPVFIVALFSIAKIWNPDILDQKPRVALHPPESP